MMLYIYTKFCDNILNGFRVMERTRFVMDGQTDNYVNQCAEGAGGLGIIRGNKVGESEKRQ